MTRARAQSIDINQITQSRLFTRVNIRKKLHWLSHDYMGAAVDFATTELCIEHLRLTGVNALTVMAHTAQAIRRAIQAVDEPYIMQAIALAQRTENQASIQDLMGNSMNRTPGADIYITS